MAIGPQTRPEQNRICNVVPSRGIDKDWQFETALAAGLTISGRTLEVFYTGMRFDDEQLDKPVGVKRMSFSMTYTAMSNTPDVLS